MLKADDIELFSFYWPHPSIPAINGFAFTINKSQGETLKYAGVWLKGEVFTHGQLYVACSRVSSPHNLHFAIFYLLCPPSTTCQQKCQFQRNLENFTNDHLVFSVINKNSPYPSHGKNKMEEIIMVPTCFHILAMEVQWLALSCSLPFRSLAFDMKFRHQYQMHRKRRPLSYYNFLFDTQVKSEKETSP